MSKIIRIIITIAVLNGFAGNIHSSDVYHVNTSQLLKWCNSSDPSDSGICQGYHYGTFDGSNWIIIVLTEEKVVSCIETINPDIVQEAFLRTVSVTTNYTTRSITELTLDSVEYAQQRSETGEVSHAKRCPEANIPYLVESPELISWCKSDLSLELGRCHGYMYGVIDGISNILSTNGSAGFSCFNSTGVESLRKGLIDFLESGSDAMSLPAARIVKMAESRVFECAQ